MSSVLKADIPRGTKIYTFDEHLRFVEYTFIGKKPQPNGIPKYELEADGGYRFLVNNHVFNQMSLSKIVILTELEEKLRTKIEYVHDLMRKHKIKFNPVDTADVVYVLTNISTFKGKEVHQYLPETGVYLRTYTSTREAAKVLGKNERGNISRAIKKNQVAYGFRWSYEKFKKLKF